MNKKSKRSIREEMLVLRSWHAVMNELKCEICGDTTNPIMAPVMTGVHFDAPREEQRFVCKDCLYVWYEYGATTAEKIREIRSTAPTSDPMLKSLPESIEKEAALTR